MAVRLSAQMKERLTQTKNEARSFADAIWRLLNNEGEFRDGFTASSQAELKGRVQGLKAFLEQVEPRND